MANKFLQRKEYIALFRLNRVALAVVLTLGSFLIPSFGHTTQFATTQVGKLCEVQAGGSYEIDQVSNPQQHYEQFTASDISAAGTASIAKAHGQASAEFGPGIPQVGITRASAGASSTSANSSASFSATVQYFFEIQTIQTGPDPTLTHLPILFGARGEGFASVEYGVGTAHSALYVNISGAQVLQGHEFKIVLDQNDQGSQEDSFDDTKSLNLVLNEIYNVIITAACQTAAYSGSAGGSATGSVWGDSFIDFDQTTFDTLKGPDTYNLADYYNIAFSDNLAVIEPPPAVPEPTTMLLFGIGLLGLAGVSRRKK